MNAIIAADLDKGKTAFMNQCFVSLYVDAWKDFLEIVWSACAQCTRDHRGQWCIKKTLVAVHLEDGRTFSTYIWYDDVVKGLRYVSLY